MKKTAVHLCLLIVLSIDPPVDRYQLNIDSAEVLFVKPTFDKALKVRSQCFVDLHLTTKLRPALIADRDYFY